MYFYHYTSYIFSVQSDYCVYIVIFKEYILIIQRIIMSYILQDANKVKNN